METKLRMRAFYKYDLCRIFGLFYSGGKPNYKHLRRYYLTDSVLEEIGMTPEEYKNNRMFTFKQSRKIADILGVTPEDFQ